MVDLVDLGEVILGSGGPMGPIQIFDGREHSSTPVSDADVTANSNDDGNSLVIGERLWSTFISERFSDMVIRCSNKTFSVHRVIMAAQSKVFEAMITGDFKEGQNKHLALTEIALPDDDPTALEVMIEYMYRGRIMLSTEFVSEKKRNHKLGNAVILAQAFAVADKYDVTGLCKNIVDLYSNQFNPVNQKTTTKPTVRGGSVDAYIEFLDSIESVYIFTPESNRALRDTALQILYDHGDFIKALERTSQELKDVRRRVFKECPDFVLDFVEDCWEGFSGSMCLDCGKKEGKKAEAVECMKCPKKIWFCQV